MNPELRRNLWLELSVHRLVAMPVVLALVLAFLAARGREWWALVFTLSFWAFVLFVHFWGTRQAAEAVTDEVRDRTWDWQRLSSLTPWQMTWGKLLGATAFAWYGGACCLAAMAIAQSQLPLDVHAGWTAAALVASGIALHGVALAGSLQAARKDSRLGTRMGTLLLVPVAILAASGVMRPVNGAEVPIEWFGLPAARQHFFALSAVAFAAWAVLAAAREMGRELEVRMLPWAYPAFALFFAAYLAGFVNDLDRTAGLFVLVAFLVSLALAYFGLFADATTATSLRRLALRVEARDWRRALEALPLWATALALAAVLGLAAVAWPMPSYLTPRTLDPWAAVFPLVLLLGAVRDAGLLVFFCLARRPRRVESATLLYMLLLWWIVPGLLGALGLPSAAQAFRPTSLAPWAGVAVMAVHVAIVGAGAAWRWRQRRLAMERGV